MHRRSQRARGRPPTHRRRRATGGGGTGKSTSFGVVYQPPPTPPRLTVARTSELAEARGIMSEACANSSSRPSTSTCIPARHTHAIQYKSGILSVNPRSGGALAAKVCDTLWVKHLLKWAKSRGKGPPGGGIKNLLCSRAVADPFYVCTTVVTPGVNTVLSPNRVCTRDAPPTMSSTLPKHLSAHTSPTLHADAVTASSAAPSSACRARQARRRRRRPSGPRPS